MAATVADSSAQTVDLTMFVGRSYPVYNEQLRFIAALPVFPRVAVRETGPLEITTDSGAVFGGALAVEFGLVAVEGRVDVTAVGFDLSGTRYDLIATAPTTVQIASITIDRSRLDAERLKLWSLNVRVRTPGRIALVASGGLSYLPGITIGGVIPVTVDAPGLQDPATVDAELRLIATPGKQEHRWGLNGGAGVRIGGDRVALMAEARAFYFREFELRLSGANGPDLLNAVASGIPAIRFEPVIVNAQAGVVFRF
jgi:hypothetical protein